MPKLYTRKQLPNLFERAGLKRMTLSTLHKLHTWGEGPPPAFMLGRQAYYDGDEAIAWRKARLAAQAASACERQEEILKWRLKQLERVQSLGKAAREGAA
jgi:single-stranded DNA-specific DHH superfamily exonuclease